MPTAAPANVDICRQVGEKKRKASAEANDESDSQKKRCRKIYCTVEGCTKQVVNGGVCVSHGAKVKFCSSEGCTNKAVNGGVCIKHGATWTRKRCRFEECKNYVVNGGVCVRHGAKVKVRLCSIDGCTNLAVKEGVCIRHGAKLKRCHVEGCTNQRVKGGVCIRHGANLVITPSTKARSGNRGNEHQQIQLQQQHQQIQQQQQQHQQHQQHHNCMGSTSRFTSLDHHPHSQQWINNSYHNHSSLNPTNWTWGRNLYCNFQGCNTIAIHSGFCSEHWMYSSQLTVAAQANNQRGLIQGGNNQNDVVALIEESDNEEEGGKKPSPDADQKPKADVSKQRSATSTSNDTGGDGLEGMNDEMIGNTGTDKDSQNGEPEQSSLGRVANPNDDNEQGKSDTILQKRAIEVGNLEGDSEQDASDVAVMQGCNGVSGGAGDDQNECDYGEDDGDVQSEEGNHPQEGPEETTVNDKEVEKEHERMLTSELGDANTMVVALSEKLIAMSEEMVAVKSRSISEREKNCSLRSQLNKAMSQYKEKSEAAAKLVAELAAEKEENAEMHTELMKATNAQLEVKAAMDAVAANLEETTKKFEAEKADLNSQVQASSKESKELNDQVIALKMELEGAARKEADLNTKLSEVTHKSDASKLLSKSMKADLACKEAELQKSAAELKKMTTDIAALNVELNKGAQNEAEMQKTIDDFASEKNRLESMQHQQQSTIEGLRDELKGQKVELKEKDEKIEDMKRKEQISVNELKEASTRLGEANTRNSSLTKQLDAMKHELRHKEDAMAKEEAERKRLHSSIDASKREHAAQIQDFKSQLKTKSDTVETLNSALQEMKASKNEVESQLQLKTTELQEMTAKVSDAEERVKSVGEKLTQELQTKRNEVSQLSANVENMKGQQEDALKREEALEDQLERLQSQMEILQDSNIKLEQEKATNDALLRTWQNEANEKSKTAEQLSAELKSKEVAMKEMSTKIAALNSKLAEHGRGSDTATILTEIGALRGLLGVANMKISKQEETSGIAMKKIEELEESTKNLPKRVQPPRRNKSSLETLAEPSRKSHCEENGRDNEEIEALRSEILATIKTNNTVTMAAVGGMNDVKEALHDAVVLPKKTAEPPGLALLYGPPGTGKTHIVSAVAHRSKCTLFVVKASDIGSKWHGESEKKITLLFEEAQKQDYSIIFIDELDCICSNRDHSSNNEDGRKILTSFLTEINRIGDDIHNVAVLAATNEPWDLDRAVQDRFDTKIYVPLPDLETRKSILKLRMKERKHSLNDDDFQRLAQLMQGATAREVRSLAKKACLGSVKCDNTYVEVNGKYRPRSRCDRCPQYQEGSMAKCRRCGAICISSYDIPDGSLECRPVHMNDFVKNLKPSYCSVTNEMRQRYEGWQGS